SVGLLTTGIGKSNAAAGVAVLLALRQVEAVVNFGCGGAFPASGLETGDLAVADAEFFGDEGALTPDGFVDMEGLGLPLHSEGDRDYFNRIPCDADLLGQ
ncbi:MAG: futalosine hydrolase, partial [Desulfuromonadales bacterium]|nr:futalosine hydrolase [Desulfuromonadales bacterium]NIS39421.1 futalosine hydrolase [Desulfuromonadales bacterium]